MSEPKKRVFQLEGLRPIEERNHINQPGDSICGRPVGVGASWSKLEKMIETTAHI